MDVSRSPMASEDAMSRLNDLIDHRLVDLTDQYEKHFRSGNVNLAQIIEGEALDLSEYLNDLESFLFFPEH